MSFQPSPYVSPLLIAAVVAAALSVYAWRRRPAPGAAAFALSLAGVAFWALANALQWASAAFPAQLFWANARLAGTEALALFFLCFAFQYTRQDRRFPRLILPLGLISLLWVALAFTNPAHGWFWARIEQVYLRTYTGLAFTYGPAFWLHTAFDYLLLTATVLLFGFSFLRARAIYRRQMGAVLLGTLIPWLTNVIFVFDLSPLHYLDLTPFGLLVGMIALTAAFFRYRILDLVSISRDTMLQHMADALLVVDRTGRLVDLNPAAEHLLGGPAGANSGAAGTIGRPVTEVFGRWPALSERLQDLGGDQTEEVRLELAHGLRFYVLQIASLRGADDEIAGHLVLIRDVTDRVETARRVAQARDEAQVLARDLASINRVAEQTTRSLRLEDILQTICKELVEIFLVRNAGIGLLDPDGDHLLIVAFHSSDPVEPDATGLRIPLDGNEASRLALESRKAVVIRDAQTDPLTAPAHELMRQRGTRSLMIVPLLARGEAIGTIGMPARDPGRIFTEPEVILAETIAIQVAGAVENARLYALTDQARVIAERDLEIGRAIQTTFFPRELLQPPDYELAAYFRAARQVAGDFYDVFPVGDRGLVAFVLADVTDKGVGAALFMALLRSLIRALSAREDFDTSTSGALETIVLAINDYIAGTHGESNMFATLFFGVLDPLENELTYVNAGHEMPLLAAAGGGERARLAPTGPAVGFLEGLAFQTGRCTFAPGDMLVAYTDGVTDARDRSGEFFGEERMDALVFEAHSSAFGLLKHIEIRLLEHGADAKQFDDITLLALRRKRGPGDHRHSLTRPGAPENILVLRDFVEAACRYLKLDDETVFAFKLAAEESVSNIINYGFRGRAPGSVRTTVALARDEAVLEVWDDGLPFDPTTAPKPDLLARLEDRPEGGLGIYLMERMADEMTYDTDPEQGNVLRLSCKVLRT